MLAALFGLLLAISEDIFDFLKHITSTNKNDEFLVLTYIKSLFSLGNIFMVILAIQFGIQPFLTKQFVPPSVDKNLIVFMGEMMKGLLRHIFCIPTW